MRTLVCTAALALVAGCGNGTASSGGRDVSAKFMGARSAALTQEQKDAIWDHCGFDIQKFCHLKPDDKNFFRKAAACLSKHGQDITDECWHALDDICGESRDDCDFDHDVGLPGDARRCLDAGGNFFDDKCFPACPSGLVFFEGRCLDLRNDPNNCGDIGNQCDVDNGDPCLNGKCVDECPEKGPTEDCGGTCTDTSSDPRSCGECGHVCKAPEHGSVDCVRGQCHVTCDQGFVLRGEDGKVECVRACEPTSCRAQKATCGVIRDGCGHFLECGGCPDHQVCGAHEPNQCGCARGQHLCETQCFRDDDPNHCGSRCTPCPNVPHSTRTCTNEVCGFVCDKDYVRIDGTCVKID